MYNQQIKIGLAALLFALAIYMGFEGNWWWFTLFIFLCGFTVLLYFKNENLLLAFWHMRKQNIEKATKAIDRVKYPERLVPSEEAYYNYLKGVVTVQNESLIKSEKFFRKALDKGLKMGHNKAICKLNLAMVAMHRRRRREATQLLSEAQKLDKYNMLTEQIQQMKAGMKRT